MYAVLRTLMGLVILGLSAATWAAPSLLFIGNSFTFGAGSAVRYYRAASVTDLNHDGIGGVPALVKSFLQQAGLDHEVFVETRGGSGLDYHLQHKAAMLSRRGWDRVVMHGYSTLDADKPTDPTKLIATATAMTRVLRERNPRTEVQLMATWSRADQTYPPGRAWSGQPITRMAEDVRAAYDKAASAAGASGVIPVGEAWNRAMRTGVADDNPYDGIAPGRINLWTHDHYHASTHGYYLEALVIFGVLAGRDPRSLGDTECSGHELGLSRDEVRALQQVAFDELAAAGRVQPAPPSSAGGAGPGRCRPLR